MAPVKNILFITADQWRGDCLSSLGHPIVKTPHLDAFAREAVTFTRHFANTSPCSPSRATLHTGLYQHNHRVAMNGTPLDRRHTNWAIEARKLGYDPALIGYTDQTPDPRDLPPNDLRLNTYEGLLPGITPIAHTGMENPGPWAEYLRTKGYALPEDERLILWMREGGPDYEEGAEYPRPFAIRAEHNDTTWDVDQAIDYVSEHRAHPWLLHLSLLRPHPPWIASEPWNKLYDPESLPPPVRRETPDLEGEQHPWLAFQLSRGITRAPGNPKKLARLRAVYYGLMSEVDDNLGRLFSHLKRERLWDDTLIIFTSDHGEELGTHWLLGKGGYFDGSYAVPCIIRDPRQTADATRGKTVDAFTEHVDIMPTLLDALGGHIPRRCDGHSLAPFFVRGKAMPWRDEAHWEFDFRDASDDSAERALGLTLDECNLSVIRSARYKYVHFANLPPLFFDLQTDPNEFHNLADDRVYAPLVLEHAQKLISWRQRHEDKTLTHMMATADGLLKR
ncbi:MAG: sulfatase-like hydrolase/transferase [Alphaproteobacteria bacterium]|nr:sulfatase-like hydrolase/transferase [Alphaproteobacteria bacterium]